MKTAALAAFIQSRNMRFAGAPVTLGKLLKMWQLPHDGTAETIDGAALEGVARYCKLTVAELTAAVEALKPVVVPPKPAPTVIQPTAFATVTIPPVAAPAAVPELPPIVIEATKPPRPEPTTVMPQAQLSDLVAASRKSEPVIETSAPLVEVRGGLDGDHEIDVSFDDVESTPIPEVPETSEATSAAKPADAKSGKSKKNKKKKS